MLRRLFVVVLTVIVTASPQAQFGQIDLAGIGDPTIEECLFGVNCQPYGGIAAGKGFDEALWGVIADLRKKLREAEAENDELRAEVQRLKDEGCE